MKFLAKILIFLCVICCFSGSACSKEANDDCTTCSNKGYIDCPNCHVKECNYTSGSLSCYDGTIRRTCSSCRGIKFKYCDYCDGLGYIMAGSLYLGDCTFCEAGKIYSSCSLCQNKGYFVEGLCNQCIDGYIGGKKCSDPNCSISYYKNEGYTYIDCPDCEKE